MESRAIKVNESKVGTGIGLIRFIWQVLVLMLIVVVMTALLLVVVVASSPIMMLLIATGIVPFANVAWGLAVVSVIAGIAVVVVGIVLVAKSGYGDESLQRKPYYDHD